MPRPIPLLALLLAGLGAACADGDAHPTRVPDGPPAPAAVSARAAAPLAGPPGARPAIFADQALTVRHRSLDFLVTGTLEGVNPAGIGLYLDRPEGIGLLPMGLTVSQSGRNLWGTGLDQDTGDPYPDWVSVFQSSAGDVFRFREGGRAILGLGIGRPEDHHVLTIQDKDNGYIENILNLHMSATGNASRYLRAFDGLGIAFAVGDGGRTGIGKDYEPGLALDVAGAVRAQAHLQVEEEVLATGVTEVLGVLDEMRQLIPLRYTPTVGDGEARYGLLEHFQHDALFPETVRRMGSEQVRAVDYAQMTTLLVAAVKELAGQVDDLEAQVRRLENGGVGAGGGVCLPPPPRRRGGEE